MFEISAFAQSLYASLGLTNNQPDPNIPVTNLL